MAAVIPTISSDLDNHSLPDSPVASSTPQIPSIDAPEGLLTVDQLDGPSLASTLKLPETNSSFLSPAPIAKPTQSIFSLHDLLDENGSLETVLGAESGKAEITVAGDGSFIETSSGSAAREIKLKYDQLAGVGPSLRSPYAITGFVNQHGKSMYRIGHRDEHSAPAAHASEVEERVTQSKASMDPSGSPRTQRRSRLSMHFPPVFSRSTISSTARPPTANMNTSSSGSRKLRKTRSIPDMSTTEPVVTSTPTFVVTGRGHSQSVTAIDHPRPSMFKPPAPERPIDAFAELMEWFTPSSSTSSNFSSHSLFNPGKVSSNTDRPRVNIPQPFGNGVIFNAPSHKSMSEPPQLPTPRHLREMQSFESGRTAKQAYAHNDPSETDSLTPIESDVTTNRPPSAIRLSAFSSPPLMPEDTDPTSETSEPMPQPSFAPSAESLRLSSHYSMEVFNVLQTYRGLPLLEKLVPELDDGTTVIKLSLAADESAAPRDDPRFVIWGEISPERDPDDYRSVSRDSLTDNSPTNVSSSSISKRRSSRHSRLRSSEASSSSKLPLADGQKVLLAATIERWIAQLTSDLNYDELLNFFLTYRTYVNAVDLCHLLICRFHWALQQPSSRQDEKVRRIVRVRTFVAIRYWLLTFFTVDFIPNRELRLLIADWLNTLIHDPILRKHGDGVDIVRRLIKVAKECKRAHTRPVDKPKTTSPPSEEPVNHVLGKSFAEATRKLPDDNDFELDLDFLPAEAKVEERTTGFPSDPANAHLAAGHGHGGVLSGNRPTSLPLSSLTILQRTDHAPGPNEEANLLLSNGTVPLTIRHSALSRAFMKTITRLGRWKRVLNPHAKSAVHQTPMGPCGPEVPVFDLNISSTGILTASGGVDKYLGLGDSRNLTKTPTPSANSVMTTLSVPRIPPLPAKTLPIANATESHHTSEQPLLVSSNSTDDTTASPIPTSDTPDSTPAPTPSQSTEPIELAEPPFVAPIEPDNLVVTLHEVELADYEDPGLSNGDTSYGLSNNFGQSNDIRRAESFRSSSTDSLGAPLTMDGPTPPTFPGKHSQWGFDVVSIDELDFSDTSSIPADDLAYPPGLKKPLRKLPMRRDFEFVRRSEVSSMGIISRESFRDSVASSTHSETSPTSSGAKHIHRWQMKSLQQTFELQSNDEEDNDVEAALRRLEGQINPRVQQEKAEKVDWWVRNIQERMANGDYDYESSLYSEDDMEGFIDEIDQPTMVELQDNSEKDFDTATLSTLNPESYSEDADGTADTPMPTQTTHQISPPLNSPPGRARSKSPIEDAVPEEIINSRVPAIDESVPANPSSKFGPEAATTHRSFILNFSAEEIAQQFSIIDRELFMGVKFEELVSEEWAECEEITVLDWAGYLGDRERWRSESQFREKTTALAAVRARFNLMVSFVVSEIVLTPPSERPALVSKFIRVAWQSYTLSNFNTLIAIITALQNEWVVKAMRKPGWSRISTFENRVFKDLKQFTTPADDFKFVRQVVESIVDSKPLESSSHAASIVSGGESQTGKAQAGSESRPAVPTACIPFIGIYLSQLHRLNKLPALIDPTSPNSVIGIDSETATFDPPAHPEVFSALVPLPESMKLEPLINVHKQRRIAEVIKSLVAGQHLASRVQFSVDKKSFHRCLRLGGLSVPHIQKALALYPD